MNIIKTKKVNSLTEKRINRQNEWSKILITILGTFIMAAAVNLVYEPMNMVVGGVSGLSIVVKEVTGNFLKGGIPIWLTTALVNVPLFLVAIKVKGTGFIKKTLLATISFTIALAVVPSYNVTNQDNVLAVLFGGMLSGIGLGLVFRSGGSTGGTDLLGAIVQHYFPHFSVAKLLLVIDSSVIILGAFIFGIHNALYAIITSYIMTKVMNSILEGMNFAKLAYIISDEHDQVAKHILEKIGRGATFIHAEGGYTKKQKRMLMCVVSNKQIVKLKEAVAEIDPNAFLIISDAREVFGEGFIQNDY